MEFSYSRQFERQYRKLPQKVRSRVAERLELLVHSEFHPLLQNHKLHGKYEEWRSINITGDFRLIYKKIDAEVMRIDAVGTHTELYD